MSSSVDECFPQEPVVEQETLPSSTSPPKKRKRGPKPGQKQNPLFDHEFWFNLCKTYTDSHNNMTQKDFLSQNLTMTPTKSHLVCFSRYLRQYQNGTLVPSSGRHRHKPSPYLEIEGKLCKFISLNQKKFRPLALSWNMLQNKCLAWAEAMPHYTSFSASPGWLASCLKRNNLQITNNNNNDVENDDARIQRLQRLHDDEIDQELAALDHPVLADGKDVAESRKGTPLLSPQDCFQQLLTYATTSNMRQEDVDLLVRFGQAMQKQQQHLASL